MDTESFESLLYFREQVLKSVDLERVDALRHDRDALFREISEVITRQVNSAADIYPPAPVTICASWSPMRSPATARYGN